MDNQRVFRMSFVSVIAAVVVHLSFASISLARGVQPSTDPIVGTWKLNPALTQRSPGMPIPPPPQRSETYRQDDNGVIELAVMTTNPDGTATTSKLTFSARGGVVTQQGAASGQMLIETRIAPGDWLVTYLANGVQFLTMRKTVSSDGKTMRQVVTGVTSQGTSFEGQLVFERQ